MKAHVFCFFSALTWELIPPAAPSRQCSRDSAWAGDIFRSVMSLTISASVIVFAGYLLLLSFVSLKAFFHLISRDSKHIVKANNKQVMCLFSALLLQYRSSLCLHLVRGRLLPCFYIASLWLWRFIWRVGWRDVFVPFSLYAWNQMIWRSRRIIVLPRAFLHEYLLEFDG